MRPRFVVLLLFAAGAIGSCGTNGGDGVMMTPDQRFAPSSLEIRVGESVTFTNESSEAHTVTAYGDRIPEGSVYFASGGAAGEDEARADTAGGLLTPGESYTVRFEEPGTYEYFCIPHEQLDMKGEIVVRS